MFWLKKKPQQKPPKKQNTDANPDDPNSSKEARPHLCIKFYFSLKISVPHIEPLTYLT